MADLDLNVKVDVKGDRVRDLGSDFDKAGTSVDTFGGRVKGGASAIGGFAGAVTGMLAIGAVSAVLDTVGNSIELASNKAEAASKVAVLYGDSADIVTAASENAATAVGLSSGAYLEAAGNIGNLTTNLGFSQEQAAGMSVEMIALAADMGSFNNADTSAVTAAMGAAFRGETEPIRQFGVMLSDAGVKAKAVELGLYSGVGAIDANAKAQATYQLILEQTTAAQGDFARTSDGLANQQKIAAAKQEEAWTKLGGAIAPLATALVPLLTAAVEGLVTVIMAIVGAVQKWMADNKGLIDIISKVAGIIIGLLAGAFAAAMTQIKGVIDFVGALFAIFQKAFTIISDIGGKIFGTLLASIKSVGDFLGGLWSTVQSVGGKIMDFLGGIFRPFGQAIGTAIDIVKKAWNAFAGFWNGIGFSIPEIRIPNPFGGDFVVGGGRFQLPQLPTLDAGGIVTGPTIAALAQNSRPEAVIPLDRLAGMGGVTVNVYAGVGDPVEIGRQVVDAIREYERANGPAF